MSRKRFSYGVLPSRDEFDDAFDWECSSTGRYKISNDRHGRNGNFDARELWHLVNSEVKDGSDESLDFVSAVLSTLGFEWI